VLRVVRSLRQLACAWLLAACGADASPAVSAAGSPAAGSPASPDASLDASEERSGLESLRACSVPVPCGRSSAQTAEQMPYIARDPFACLMHALAGRTPGRYEHEVIDTNTFSSTARYHAFVVTAEGSVRYAIGNRYSSAVEPAGTESSGPSRHCVLRPASYFEACALALESFTGVQDSEAWRCASADIGMAWFESCQQVPLLSCE
jgi:hypothetical protein